MPDYPPDLMFLEAGQIHRPSSELISEIRTIGLRPVVAAWLANVERFLLPHFVLDALTHSMALHERARYRVCMELAGRPFLMPDDPEELKDSLRERARAEWLTFTPQAFAGEDTAPESLLSAADLAEIIGSLSRYAFAPTGLERMLENQITNAWTAFEVLGGDLWEAALNVHPHHLSELRGRAKKNAAKAETSEGDSLVQVKMLQRYGFDLRDRMGSILRSKFSFTIIDGIREAYAKAFGADATATTLLGDKCLDALAVLRNVLEHKAGRADEEYVRRVKGLAVLPAADVGDKISLNGKIILSVVQPTIWLGMALIKEVDAWIAMNPVPKGGAGNT